MLRNKFKIGILLVSVIMLIAEISHSQIVFDFEDETVLDEWEVVDEAPKNLGDQGPSTWQIKSSGLDGKALYQDSNIWGSAGDTCLMGTFILYKGEEFKDFIIDVDVLARDNDGMGLTWAYEDTDRHYRVMMCNDAWPDVPVDGVKGPFIKIQKRISDDEPWYELLEAEKQDYTPYSEGLPLHWTLEVSDGSFTFTSDNGVTISAEDDEYEEGYVGIQLYAQQAEFDNFTIVNTFPVNPFGKLSTMWARVKDAR